MSDEPKADVNEQGGAGAAAVSGNGAARGEHDGLRLLSLLMENIGPFDSAEIAFATGDEGGPPVTILTGENGTGKSIVLDAIRGMFGHHYAKLERPIQRAGVSFQIALQVRDERGKHSTSSTSLLADNDFNPRRPWPFWQLPVNLQTRAATPPRWVVDFWRSNLATDKYAIPALSHPEHRKYLSGALQGQYRNQDVTALLCYFDYLRDSREPREKQSGEAVYELARTIVSRSLLDGGELLHVRRSDLTPIVRQAGQEIPLANLSSGNAYLVQHLIGLLGKMFSLHVLLGTDPAKLHEASGVLLIDEAENHLHPRWQKRFLPTVRELYPNVQIIVTTHSPFIVASVPDARVLVCRYEPAKGACTITDETADYANKPIEDILRSDAFDSTEPFSEEITLLLEERERAVSARDRAAQKRIEAELLAKNPSYFRYFEIEERLAQLQRGAA